MKLDKYQILELFNSEKIADEDTGVYDIHFNKLVEKLSLSDDDKNLIRQLYKQESRHLNTEMKHLNKVATLLDNKIEPFTNDYWELFSFRKHAYLSSYSERKWDEFNESYESVKEVKKRAKILKSHNVNVEQLEIFFNQLSYIQDGYIDLWFDLKKKSKNPHLSEDMKERVINYGNVDTNDSQKAIMLSYFREVTELENLYIKNLNTAYKRDIENELSKFKKIEQQNENLFIEETNSHIVYRKNITVKENALIYQLNKDKKYIDKVMKVINEFLAKEIYKIKVDYDMYESNYNYALEGYSEKDVEDKENIVKKAFTHLPELLVKKEYNQLFKEDSFINTETRDFFKQYMKSSEIYKHLNNKLPENQIKEKKNKI